MDNKSDVVAATARDLAVEAEAITSAVTRHLSVESLLTPLALPARALAANATTLSVDYSKALEVANSLSEEEGWTDILHNFSIYGQKVAQVLGTGDLEDIDTAKGDDLADTLSTMVKLANLMYEVDAETLALAAVSKEAWVGAVSTLESATSPKVRGRDVPSNTGTRGPRVRGDGMLVESSGYRVLIECQKCHKIMRAGSTFGSAQDQCKNHYGTCHQTYVPYAGNPIHTAFTKALHGAWDSRQPKTGKWEGGGYVMTREYM